MVIESERTSLKHDGNKTHMDNKWCIQFCFPLLKHMNNDIYNQIKDSKLVLLRKVGCLN